MLVMMGNWWANDVWAWFQFEIQDHKLRVRSAGSRAYMATLTISKCACMYMANTMHCSWTLYNPSMAWQCMPYMANRRCSSCMKSLRNAAIIDLMGNCLSATSTMGKTCPECNSNVLTFIPLNTDLEIA